RSDEEISNRQTQVLSSDLVHVESLLNPSTIEAGQRDPSSVQSFADAEERQLFADAGDQTYVSPLVGLVHTALDSDEEQPVVKVHQNDKSFSQERTQAIHTEPLNLFGSTSMDELTSTLMVEPSSAVFEQTQSKSLNVTPPPLNSHHTPSSGHFHTSSSGHFDEINPEQLIASFKQRAKKAASKDSSRPHKVSLVTHSSTFLGTSAQKKPVVYTQTFTVDVMDEEDKHMVADAPARSAQNAPPADVLVQAKGLPSSSLEGRALRSEDALDRVGSGQRAGLNASLSSSSVGSTWQWGLWLALLGLLGLGLLFVFTMH
ncbi:MAG: hypothetical protein AAGJ35_16170, partial [Myxococcota bacterium]